jgi:hypothetical protein
MPRTIRYHPAFETDVATACEWYDDKTKSHRVGNDFIECVATTIDNLIGEPDSRSIVDYGIRYWPVDRFPHIVLYDLTDSMIRILGLMHTSQDAGKWLKGRG